MSWSAIADMGKQIIAKKTLGILGGDGGGGGAIPDTGEAPVNPDAPATSARPLGKKITDAIVSQIGTHPASALTTPLPPLQSVSPAYAAASGGGAQALGGQQPAVSQDEMLKLLLRRY